MEKAICKIKTGLHKSWIILRQILLQKKNISSCTHSPFYYSIKQLYFFLYVSSFYRSIQRKTIMLRYHAFCFLFWPILKYHFMKAILSLYCSKKKDNVLSNIFYQIILIFWSSHFLFFIHTDYNFIYVENDILRMCVLIRINMYNPKEM